MTQNNFINPLLSDKYQFTMAHAYFKNGRHNEPAVFDLFFRSCPFGGEFSVFAGLEGVLGYLENFKFSDRDIEFLRDGKRFSKKELKKRFNELLSMGTIRKSGKQYEILSSKSPDFEEIWDEIEYPTHDSFIKSPLVDCDPEFFEWLKTVDGSEIKAYALHEGSLAFPRIPLIRVEGPLAVSQLLETGFLNLTNFPTLMTTNAARFRLAAGWKVSMLEFGLRRAQGPDGGMSASKYAYMGGFDGTSNMLAAKIYGISAMGTLAHSYISSYDGLSDLKINVLRDTTGQPHDFVNLVLEIRKQLKFQNTNEGELAAMISYAIAFPKGFLTLVDTYNTLKSGVPNFICVATALMKLGYTPIGLRLDSGDLSYLSKEARKLVTWASKQTGFDISGCTIVASNDIDEKILIELKQQKHQINSFGIGTKLVTCQAQSALGGVYKLVSINGIPKIKIAENGKVTISGKKEAYRIYVRKEKSPFLDLMIEVGQKPPQVGQRILCRDPFDETKRVGVTPTKVEKLHTLVWDGRRIFAERQLDEIRGHVMRQIKLLSKDYLRLLNPKRYKVSLSEQLYDRFHELWMKESTIEEY